MWSVLVSLAAILACSPVDGFFFFRIPTYNPFSAIYTVYNSFQTQGQQYTTKLDALLDSFIEDIRSGLPTSCELTEVESVYPLGRYLCANLGFVTDLKTLKKSEATQYVWNYDGSMDITVYLSFESLKAVYQVFHFETPLQKSSGKMVLTYGTNKLAVWLKIPVVAMLPNMLESAQASQVPCFMFYQNAWWDELEVTVDTDTDDISWAWMKKKNIQFFVTSDKALLEKIRSSVLEEVHNKIAHNNTSQAVCIYPTGDTEKDTVKDTKVVKSKKLSDTFTKLCSPSTSVESEG